MKELGKPVYHGEKLESPRGCDGGLFYTNSEPWERKWEPEPGVPLYSRTELCMIPTMNVIVHLRSHDPWLTTLGTNRFFVGST